MTTTPDSRIAHDFGLGPIDTSTTATPDTSTTAGKIAVMQAYERGERIQAVTLSGIELEPRSKADEHGCDRVFSWDWFGYDYRIAPPPVPPTALQMARTVARKVAALSAREGDVALCRLVTEIGSSDLVYVHHSCPIYTESGQSITHGRYRLVRDEAP